MKKSKKPKDADADEPKEPSPTSQRIKRLRKGLRPRPEQLDIAKLLGKTQAWVSRRETGVEPTVSEAILLLDALGYAAELLILEKRHSELVRLFGVLSPEDTSRVLRFAAALPYLEKTAMRVIDSLLEEAEEKKAAKVSGDDRQAL